MLEVTFVKFGEKPETIKLFPSKEFALIRVLAFEKERGVKVLEYSVGSGEKKQIFKMKG